jgi:hypothetical protein
MSRHILCAIATATLLATLATGCSVDAPSCQTTADCPNDLVCESTGGVLFQGRACVSLSTTDTGGTDGGDLADTTEGCADGGSPVTVYADEDGDQWGVQEESRTICSTQSLPEGFAAESGDCAPGDPDRHPEAEEVCNGEDDNCNGEADENLQTSTWYRDPDEDGFAGMSAESQDHCTNPSTETSKWVERRGDCAPDEPTAHPDGTEVCDDLDNNCNGDTDEGCDDDGDGYCDADLSVEGSDIATCPKGGGDCKDAFKAVHPNAEEICDGADNDCSGVADEGCACNYQGKTNGVCQDGDISPRDGMCTPPPEYEQEETSSNCDGLDNDCDGSTDEGC